MDGNPMPKQRDDNELISENEVARLMHVRKEQFREMVQEKRFPPPIKDDPDFKRWRYGTYRQFSRNIREVGGN
jgi:predicted DNA-binding transcriptional regulator AlpA